MPATIDLSKGTNRELLNMAGLRSTSQRALILDIIRSGQGHLDADEVYRRARRKQPRISLSTVYRTLQALKELELVEELHFNCPMSEKIKEDISNEKGFEVTSTEVRMRGYCPDCRKKKR